VVQRPAARPGLGKITRHTAGGDVVWIADPLPPI
jgi:hypothetical protein